MEESSTKTTSSGSTWKGPQSGCEEGRGRERDRRKKGEGNREVKTGRRRTWKEGERERGREGERVRG
eukprot:3937041-Rhodomonas_salina.1